MNTALILAATLRVAVQSFENLTARPEDAWIGPVAADAVGGALASVEGIAVIERRQLAALVQEIKLGSLAGGEAAFGALAGADVLVTGSVAVTPESVRLTVKVLDVGTGATRASLADDAPAAELLAHLDALAAKVGSALGKKPRPRPPPLPLEAYRALSLALDALFAWRLDDAESELATAARLAPGSALVECGMANLLVTRFTNHKTEDRAILYQAIGHAATAAALDAALGEPSWAMGRAYNALGQRELALEALRAAVAREPNRALFRVSLGWAHTRAGDHAAACGEYAEAAKLAPAMDLPFWNLGTDLAYAGKLDDALLAYDRAAQTFPVPDWVLGDLEDGVAWHQKPELHALRAALLAWQGQAAKSKAAMTQAWNGKADPKFVKQATAAAQRGARKAKRGPGVWPADACAGR